MKKVLQLNSNKTFFWSGWQDSNLRPPAPKAGAIPGYATPRTDLLLLLCSPKAGANIKLILT